MKQIITSLLILTLVLITACSTVVQHDQVQNEDTNTTKDTNTSLGNGACTKEYKPVCGLIQVQCIRAPCPPIQVTFENDCLAQAQGAMNITLGACVDEHPDPKGACLSFDGNWIEDSQECEGMGQEQCESLGGHFNECASACRNDPTAQICTLQCVAVCEFDSTASSATTETFVIGPELVDCVGVGPQQCMVVNGKNFYDNIEGFNYKEGFEYEITVKKTEREQVPADANKYVYELVEIVSQQHTCTDAEKERIACTKEYVPVCGIDGQTYSNGCGACSAGIDSYKVGSCEA